MYSIFPVSSVYAETPQICSSDLGITYEPQTFYGDDITADKRNGPVTLNFHITNNDTFNSPQFKFVRLWFHGQIGGANQTYISDNPDRNKQADGQQITSKDFSISITDQRDWLKDLTNNPKEGELQWSKTIKNDDYRDNSCPIKYSIIAPHCSFDPGIAAKYQPDQVISVQLLASIPDTPYTLVVSTRTGRGGGTGDSDPYKASSDKNGLVVFDNVKLGGKEGWTRQMIAYPTNSPKKTPSSTGACALGHDILLTAAAPQPVAQCYWQELLPSLPGHFGIHAMNLRTATSYSAQLDGGPITAFNPNPQTTTTANTTLDFDFGTSQPPPGPHEAILTYITGSSNPALNGTQACSTESFTVNPDNTVVTPPRFEIPAPFTVPTTGGGKPCGDPAADPGIVTAIGCIHTSPASFVKDLLKFVFGIGGGIAFLMMLMGAFQMITSAGNPDTLHAGRDRFTSAIIGLLFIIFAVLLMQIISIDILGLGKFGGFGN